MIHYYWLVKSDVRLPLMYGAILGILMLYRWSLWLDVRAEAHRRAARHHSEYGVPSRLVLSEPLRTSKIPGSRLVHRVAGVFHDQLPGIRRLPVMGSMGTCRR